MSYAELRKARQDSEVNTNLFDFTDHLDRIPTLHSGFLEPCPNKPEYSAFKLSIWYSNHRYKALLQDRMVDEKAFIDLGRLLGAFEVLEAALKDHSLEWTPDSGARSNWNGR